MTLLTSNFKPRFQDHHGRDPYRVALRNNNAAVAELLESHMKRLSDYRGAVTRDLEGEEDSPLYASPTAYGYSKIGEHRPGARAGAGAGHSKLPETQILAGQSDLILLIQLTEKPEN